MIKNLEILGLPENLKESTSELTIKIAYAGIKLTDEQIVFAHRVQPMQNVGDRQLQNRTIKDNIISGLRKTKGITTSDIGQGGPAKRFFVNEHLTSENRQLLKIVKSRAISVAQNRSWSCSLGLVLAFLQDQGQEQDRLILARPRPRLTVQDLSKNKTKPARLLRLAVRNECRFREYTIGPVDGEQWVARRPSV